MWDPRPAEEKTGAGDRRRVLCSCALREAGRSQTRPAPRDLRRVCFFSPPWRGNNVAFSFSRQPETSFVQVSRDGANVVDGRWIPSSLNRPSVPLLSCALATRRSWRRAAVAPSTGSSRSLASTFPSSHSSVRKKPPMLFVPAPSKTQVSFSGPSQVWCAKRRL